MKKVCLTGIMILLTMVFMFSPVSAELISMDWKTGGDNNITYNSVTGLEWLDISVTLGISTDEMLAEFSSGGEYYGFRYATISELNGLTDAFGIEYCSSTGFTTKANVARVQEMHDLFGGAFHKTGTPNWYTDTVYGYTVNALTNEVWRQEYGLKFIYSSPPAYSWTTTVGGLDYGEGNFQNSLTGHFIVKDIAPVPEPATIFLLGTGLIGMSGMIRRKTKK